MGKPGKYDLEERTFEFARRCRAFIKAAPFTISNKNDLYQLGKASGSVGANYIEANDAFSRKDYFFRVKVCRKEAKESRFWLRLIDLADDEALEVERSFLIQESTELMKIFGAIIRKNGNET